MRSFVIVKLGASIHGCLDDNIVHQLHLHNNEDYSINTGKYVFEIVSLKLRVHVFSLIYMR